MAPGKLGVAKGGDVRVRDADVLLSPRIRSSGVHGAKARERRRAAQRDPSPPTLGEQRIDVLTQEADRVGKAIHELYISSATIVAATLSLATLATTIGRDDRTRYANVVLSPFLALALLLYSLDRNSEMRALGGYKRYLEEEVNQLIEKPALLWESWIAPAE